MSSRPGGLRIPIADAAALIRSYAVVFTPALNARIARGTPTSTGASAMLDDALEMRRVGDALKITRITVPVAAEPESVPQPPSSPAPERASRAAPDRLAIAVGRAQRAGSLAPGGRATYVIFAPKNRLLEVQIEGVRGRDIVARIVRVRDGAPVDARAAEGVRTWSGRVPEEGDYRIEVVRLAREPAAPMPFTLTVSAR